MASSRPRSVAEEIRQRIPLSRGQEAMVALLKTADDIRHYFAHRLAPDGITLQQYNVLRILRGAGSDGLPTLDIAERMVERHPGVTRLVDRLIGKGLVERRRGVEDRRQVFCSITPEGLALLTRLDGEFEAGDRLIRAVLPGDDLTSLIERLDRVREGFREADQGGS